MPDAGEVATVQLVVDPYDETTEALLTVRAPDGTTTTPSTSTADEGQTWTAQVTYAAAGIWRLMWTVTGTGADVTYEPVSVAPVPDNVGAGRVYATTTQLAEYLHAAAPLESPKLLTDASRALDDALLTALYDTDDDGMPTDLDVVAAFTEAVCAIVEWWEETGDPVGADGGWQSATAGPVSLTRGSDTTTAQPVAGGYLPPRATAALRRLPPDKLRLGVVATPW